MRQARNEAGRLGHDYIGPEHFLLGLIRKGEGLAVQVLLNLDVDPDALKRETEGMLERGKGSAVGIFPQNAEAKKVIERARFMSKQLKHNWIGTEHLLLALIKCDGTIPSRVLRGCGVGFENAMAATLELILGPQGAYADSPRESPPRGFSTGEVAASVGEAHGFGEAALDSVGMMSMILQWHRVVRMFLDLGVSFPELEKRFAAATDPQFDDRAYAELAAMSQLAPEIESRHRQTLSALECLILAILKDEDSRASQVLRSLGVTYEKAEAELLRIAGEDQDK